MITCHSVRFPTLVDGLSNGNDSPGGLQTDITEIPLISSFRISMLLTLVSDVEFTIVPEMALPYFKCGSSTAKSISEMFMERRTNAVSGGCTEHIESKQ